MMDREEGKSLGVGNGMQSGIEEAKLPWTVEGIQPGREVYAVWGGGVYAS